MIKHGTICTYQETNAGFADPTLTARLIELGSIPMPGSPVHFKKFVGDEIEKWSKVIKFAKKAG